MAISKRAARTRTPRRRKRRRRGVRVRAARLLIATPTAFAAAFA
ncbi:hypothetical protein [Xanthomonas oryzae]|nr:hypothetical protein [Xanthomonas oryzae]